MRYFIIADEGGNPIYYDHKDGRLLSLVLVNTHIMMKENLGQRFKSMTCGHTLFVFQKYEKLSFLVVSDQGESEMFLRSLLRQIFEHMVMVFGRQAIEEGKYSTFSRHKLTIQHIIDTLCALSDRQQSLLVRATERLEVDDRTRGECFKALKNALKQEPLATHGLLFVGTKLLVTYSKNKAPDIDPSDMLILINDFRATFHPYEREVEETVISAADYSQVSATLSTQESGYGERDRDEGFVSASEELTWDEDGKFTQDSSRLLSADICDALYDKVYIKAQELEREKAARQMQKEREQINQSSESFKRLFMSPDEAGSAAMGNLGKSSLNSSSGRVGGVGGSSGMRGSGGSGASLLSAVSARTADEPDDSDSGSTRRRKKSIRRKSSRVVSRDASGERWDERIEQWREEQREKELDKQKQEGEREETVESNKDILVADFLENLDKGEFKIGLTGDCVLLLQEMLHLISFFPGALDGRFGEKSALSVSAFQETSRIPVTGAVDLVTAKLLLEQVMSHFKKPKTAKKKVAFVEDEVGTPPGGGISVGSGSGGGADSGAHSLLLDSDGGNSGGGDKAKEAVRSGERSGKAVAAATAGSDGDGEETGSSSKNEGRTRSKASADEMEPESSTDSERRASPLPIGPGRPHNNDDDDDSDTFLTDGSQDYSQKSRPLIPSSPVDGSAMIAAEPKTNRRLGREDSSSSDEAGFVSPLASPHNVAPHRSLKEEIEREKQREREREEDAQHRRHVAAEKAEEAEAEAERRTQGGPPKEGDSETTGDSTAQRKRERTVGESSEDLGLSLDDVDFDHPFPELDYNLRQPFDPENSTSYKLLHLRTPKYTPRWVYYAELERMTTLVIITSNHPTTGAKGQPQERDRLDEIRDQLRGMIRNYATYLITKEHTHLPVLSFLHQFPGLIHFIFVDRTFNRVIAPPITAVHGPLFTPKPEEALRMKLILRSKVWDMCYRAQQHLSEGHHAMTMKSGTFQYSYRLWVEDMEGFELPFNHDQPFIAQRGPQTHKYYKKLVEHIFPSRSGLRCYELYTLYLGVLSVKSITHYDRNLVAILLDRKNK